MSEYTPTTAQIREVTVASGYYDSAEFNRWLAAHDAEVRKAALAEALHEEAFPMELLTFREAWEEADRQGKTGGRVRAGLAAMLRERAKRLSAGES